jgi:hypothetical protein
MAQYVTAGWGAYVNYGYEATFGSGAVSARTFGRGIKITTTRRNTMERIYGLGSRNATANVAKKYEGTASAEFLLSNGSFWRAVLGSVADGGGGPYTHTYTETNIIPSFAIDTGTELGANDEVTELKGCKVMTCTLTAAIDEVVKVRLECPYQTETLATSGIGSQVAESSTAETFTFAQGILQLPSGSTIGNVQSFELTMNNSLEGVWGLGSRIKTASIEKIREYNLRMTVAFSDVTTLLTKFYGASGNPLDGNPASTATLILTFTNGGSGTAERSHVMTLANIYLDENTLPKDVNEVIKEDVTGWALSGTSVVYTDNTSVDAGYP